MSLPDSAEEEGEDDDVVLVDKVDTLSSRGGPSVIWDSPRSIFSIPYGASDFSSLSGNSGDDPEAFQRPATNIPVKAPFSSRQVEEFVENLERELEEEGEDDDDPSGDIAFFEGKVGELNAHLDALVDKEVDLETKAERTTEEIDSERESAEELIGSGSDDADDADEIEQIRVVIAALENQKKEIDDEIRQLVRLRKSLRKSNRKLKMKLRQLRGAPRKRSREESEAKDVETDESRPEFPSSPPRGFESKRRWLDSEISERVELSAKIRARITSLRARLRVLRNKL